MPCWKRLLNDWFDGRIDQAYPVRCYREAIDKLPEDVDAYSSAREDIRRALLAAIRSQGGSPPGPNEIVPPPPGRNGGGGRTSNAPGAEATPAVAGPTEGDDGILDRLFRAVAPGDADSVPLPLIVLAALALLLLAAAGAGLVTRYLQARREATPEVGGGQAP